MHLFSPFRVMQQMNVILVSSDYSFLDRLGDIRFGFDLSSIQRTLYASEWSPSQAYSVMANDWEVDKRLAKAMIDHFGGNVRDIYLQLRELSVRGASYIPGFHTQTDDVQSCLAFPCNGERMRELLVQLAENGFVPLLDRKEAEVLAICKYNVGGIVKRQQSIVIGLPNEVWGDYTVALVPYKQSIRLVIAKVLDQRALISTDHHHLELYGFANHQNKKTRMSILE